MSRGKMTKIDYNRLEHTKKVPTLLESKTGTFFFVLDAVERTRTSTGVSPHGPEPCASANSATTA